MPETTTETQQTVECEIRRRFFEGTLTTEDVQATEHLSERSRVHRLGCALHCLAYTGDAGAYVQCDQESDLG